MTLKQIWDAIYNNPGFYPAVIFIILSVVEVSKIKLNPWTALGKLVGKFIGIESMKKDIDKKMDAFAEDGKRREKKIEDLARRVDERDAVDSRVRILRFAGEIQDGRFHNKDLWDQTMMDIVQYEKYVSEHPDFKNGITEPTTEYLKSQYRKRLEKKDWDKKND